MSETKLRSDISTLKFLDSQFGYEVFRKDRNTAGGGVLLAVKDIYQPEHHEFTDEPKCESVFAKINLNNQKTLHIGSVYRPPSSQTHKSLTEIVEN